MKINEIFTYLENSTSLIKELDQIIEKSQVLNKDTYYKKNNNLVFIGNYIPFLCLNQLNACAKNLNFLIDRAQFNHFKKEQTISLDFKNHKNYNFEHIFAALNIKIKYNMETKKLILSHDSNDYLLEMFFNKKLLNFEFFIFGNNSSVYIYDFLQNIQPVCKTLDIKLCSSILEHLLIVNKSFCSKTVTSYFLDNKKLTAYMIEETQSNFFSTSNQLWQDFKYKIPNTNAFYLDPYYSQLSMYLPSFINFTNKIDNDKNTPLHPFFLNKKKIDRLLYFFKHTASNFVLFFYNQIIQEDIIIRKDLTKVLSNSNISNLFLYVKNNKIALKDFVRFLEKNSTQPEAFWFILLNNYHPSIKNISLKQIQVDVEQKLHNLNKSKISCFKHFKSKHIYELDSFEALAKEGELMSHCVKTKSYLLKYFHKFFHIQAGLFNRHSTLQLTLVNDHWQIVMHNGKKNKQPSRKHKQIAQNLVDFLNQQ
jgi:hypothetical protein